MAQQNVNSHNTTSNTTTTHHGGTYNTNLLAKFQGTCLIVSTKEVKTSLVPTKEVPTAKDVETKGGHALLNRCALCITFNYVIGSFHLSQKTIIFTSNAYTGLMLILFTVVTIWHLATATYKFKRPWTEASLSSFNLHVHVTSIEYQLANQWIDPCVWA